MTEEEKVNRKNRHYIPFESRKPRLRNSCPKCGSVNVRKRRTINNYVCYRCGWTGENALKIEY